MRSAHGPVPLSGPLRRAGLPESISQALFEHVTPPGGLALCLYDVTTLYCQAPGFVEAGLSGFGDSRLWLFLVVLLGVGGPGGFVLGGGGHADGGVGPDGARPVDPPGGGDQRRRQVSCQGPWIKDELGLVHGVQRLGQSIVVGVPLGTHRGDRLALGQSLPVADGTCTAPHDRK